MASSAKEDNLRNYLDGKLTDISGKYERRHQEAMDVGLGTGFESFQRLACELEQFVDVLWVSSTRMIVLPLADMAQHDLMMV